MTSIMRAKETDAALLVDIAKRSFIESHGHSASPEDISQYIKQKYTYEKIKEELSDPENIYHIIYHDQQPAGYSKIIFNVAQSDSNLENITKLERLYLLKEFYGLKLGLELFQFNVELSIQNSQKGMWLYVWKENRRAIDFYTSAGFVITGSHDFKLSETHSNPNHQMLLMY
jgi:ribosomal protein S18 acetylase RimI-like enzyme